MNFIKHRLKKILNGVYSMMVIYNIVILVITMLINIFIFLVADASMKSESQKVNNAVLLYVTERIETKFENMRKLAFNLNRDARCISFVFDESIDRINERDIIDYMREENQFADTSDNVYVVSNINNRVLSYDGVWDGDFFYDTVLSKGLTREEWNDICTKQRNIGCFKSLDVMTDSVRSNRMYSCIQSYFRNNNIWGKPDGCILVITDVDKLIETSLYNVIGYDKGTCYLFDGNGDIITSVGNNDPLPERSVKDTKSIQYKIDGKGYVASFCKSKTSDWQIAFVTPKEQYWYAVKKIQYTAIIGFIFCIITGIWMSVVLAKRNYKPIRNLVTNVAGNENIEGVVSGSEFEYISAYIENTRKNADIIDEKLYEMSHMAKDTYLQALIAGKQTDTDKLEECGIEFNKEKYVTVLFRIDDCSRLYSKEYDESINNTVSRAEFLIRNVGDELFAEIGMCYSTIYNADVVFVLNIDRNQTDIVSHKCEIIREFFDTKLKLKLSAAIGASYNEIAGIEWSYYDAVNAAEYCFIFGKNSVLTADGLSDRSDTYKPVQNGRGKVGNIFASGNRDKLCEWVDSECEALMQQSITVIAAKCFIYDVITIISDALRGQKNAYTIDKWEKYIPSLIVCETIMQFREKLKSVLSELISNNVGESDSKKIATLIVDYVDDNLGNFELSVNSIGEFFGMSPSYISRIFKSECLMKLSDYINLRRIKKAKELLINTDETITSIAEQIGYLSGNTMIRIFKKYEGIAPGQFRRNAGNIPEEE